MNFSQKGRIHVQGALAEVDWTDGDGTIDTGQPKLTMTSSPAAGNVVTAVDSYLRSLLSGNACASRALPGLGGTQIFNNGVGGGDS
jgi:hypothetical protein